MKKGIFCAIIILLFLGFVFYLGLVSVKVPAGSYGILQSRTSGVTPKIIENGVFSWQWEAVIPKNAVIHTFTKEKFRSNQKIRGALPSADIYSSLVKGNPDFSYSFDFDITLEVIPESVVTLLKNGEISSQNSLNSYLSEIAEKIADSLCRHLIDSNEENLVALYDIPSALEKLNFAEKYKSVKICDVIMKNASIPDVHLYKIARNSYEKFQALVDSNIGEAASVQAERILTDERSVQKLTKIGELLKQYPELNALLSNGSTADVLKALNDLN